MEVGDRLKKIRQMHGLSQRELAKRVGLTNSTISMIERNTVSPSVSSLKRILGGVNMSITEFFTADFQAQPQVVFKADELVNIGTDGVELNLVGISNSDSQLAFLIEKYDPGSDTGPDMMTHKGEEAGTIIEGSIEITVAGTTYKLSKGDSYKFSTQLPHRFLNRSKKVCKIVSAHTPPTF